MDTADQTARAGCPAGTTTGKWLYWRNTPPLLSDQLSPIVAVMTSATSLSLSIYNLLLYGVQCADFSALQADLSSGLQAWPLPRPRRLLLFRG